MSELIHELPQEYSDIRYKVHQLWEADHESQPTPAELFHYTSAEAFQNILQNKILWASEALSMNDPTEGIYPGGFVRDRLIQRKESIPQTILDLFSEESLTQILGCQVFVSSFCDGDDVLGQWRAYGRDGRGYAIGFSPNQLLDGIKETVHLARVEYDAQKVRALADEIIAYAVGVVTSKQLPGDQAEPFWGYVANFLLQSLMRYKNPAFREEKEWRLIAVPNFQAVKFRVVGARLVPYCELRFPIEAIRTVRLGPRYSTRENRAVTAFLRSIGAQTVSVENSIVLLA